MTEETNDGDALQHVGTIEAQYLVPPEPVPVAPRPHPSGSGEVLVVREGYRVHELEGPKRCRREHRFGHLESFAAWLNRHASGREHETEILLSADRVEALLFDSDRTRVTDRVECTLAYHHDFEAWVGMFRMAGHKQEALYRHVLTQAKSLGDQAQPIAVALQAVKIASSGDFSAEVDPLGYLKLVGGTGRQEASVKLPPRFSVTVPVYDGVKVPGTEDEATYTLDVFLGLVIVGEGPEKRAAFTLSCPSVLAVQRRAGLDAAAYLQSILDDGFLVGFGTAGVADVAR